MTYSTTVAKTRDYYENSNILNFHHVIYGDEHIHVGIYQTGNEPIADANLKTLELISSFLKLNPSSKILDIGSGYGGAARYLARNVGCHVDCVNLSTAQNDLNRKLNQQQGLDTLIQVFDGSFQEIPTPSNQYDTVLSQEALVFSSDRTQVFQEVSRVLQKGGQLLLTDVMLSDSCPAEVHEKTLEIVGIKSIASVKTYREIAEETGFDEVQVVEMPKQITNQYQKTLDSMELNFDSLLKVCDQEFLEYQRIRLGNWITIGNQGHLNWGFLHFRKR